MVSWGVKGYIYGWKNKIEKFSNKITLQEYNAEKKTIKPDKNHLRNLKTTNKTILCEFVFLQCITSLNPIVPNTPTFFKTNI